MLYTFKCVLVFKFKFIYFLFPPSDAKGKELEFGYDICENKIHVISTLSSLSDGFQILKKS